VERSHSKPRYSEKQRTGILCQTSSQDCPNDSGAYGAHISDDALFFYDVRRRRRAPHSGCVDNVLPAPDNKPPQIVGGQPSVPEKDLAHLPRRVNFSDSEHLPDEKQQPTVGGQPSALDQYLADLPQCFQMVKTVEEDCVVGGYQQNSGVSSANEFSTGESRYPRDCVVGEHIHCNRIPPNDCESKSGGLSEVASCYTEPWYSPWHTRVPTGPCHNLCYTSLPQPHQDSNVGPCTNKFAWGLRRVDGKAQGNPDGCVPVPGRVPAVNMDMFGHADGIESGQLWPRSAPGSTPELPRHPTHLQSLGWSVTQQNSRIEWLSTVLS
jgi:hypothetical protein